MVGRELSMAAVLSNGNEGSHQASNASVWPTLVCLNSWEPGYFNSFCQGLALTQSSPQREEAAALCIFGPFTMDTEHAAGANNTAADVANTNLAASGANTVATRLRRRNNGQCT